MAKVVHLSSVHPAQDTRILHRECRSLAEAGHDVVLIANSENDFTEHGVSVRGLGDIPENRFIRMTRHVFKVLRLACKEHADLYQFHDPELLPVGVLLRLGGAKVIYDVHESVHELILSKYWIPLWMRRFTASAYRQVEKTAVCFLNGVVAATPHIASFYPKGKTVVVQNFPVVSEFQPSRVIPDYQPEVNVTYIGGLTEERGLKEMMEAIALVGSTHDVTLLLGGLYAPSELREIARSYPGANRTRHLGHLNRSQVANVLQKSAIGLVTLHPVPNHMQSYPIKLFEYMAAGLPVVASDFPFWRQFVTDVGAGVMVDPLSPQSIAEGIRTILDDSERACAMGAAGAKAVRERFNWDSEAEKLIALVNRWTGSEMHAQ